MHQSIVLETYTRTSPDFIIKILLLNWQINYIEVYFYQLEFIILGFEFPQINYREYNTKKYRYAYGAGFQKTNLDSVSYVLSYVGCGWLNFLTVGE